MNRFNVATVDGKEITVELDVDLTSPELGELLHDVLKPGGFLLAREVATSPGRKSKLRDIMIFGSAIVAIREAEQPPGK
jgi:hypothetical protein